LIIKEANTLYDVSFKLKKIIKRAIVQIKYANAIGSLMYVMHCTRLGIIFMICKLSRYTSNPSKDHWKEIIKVLDYLKKTMNFRLFYNNFPIVL